MTLLGNLRDGEPLRRNRRQRFPRGKQPPYLGRRPEEKRIVPRPCRGDCEVSAQHRMQPPGELTRSTVGNRRLTRDHDAVRNLVLLSQLRGQGGITKPTFLSRLPVNTRRQGKKTRSHKDDGMTNAHGSYLKINPW